jgi:F-type H+-transporting ATPase subunit a
VAEQHNPMAQFEIKPLVSFHLGNLDLSFTNAALFMFIVVGLACALMIWSVNSRSLVPTRMQSIAEMAYEFVQNMLNDVCGPHGRPYFSFVFTLFTFVLFCNLVGMVPYTFTVTSHIAVTGALAITIFVGVTLIGIFKHGAKFLGLFAPHGAPVWILPVLVPIEVLSYFVRPLTLSLRLFANMTAGHTLLKVIGGFVSSLGVIFGILPLAFIAVMTGFELIVAILQAYIFTILTCVYLNDALHPSH